jgi:hypothetical protein
MQSMGSSNRNSLINTARAPHNGDSVRTAGASCHLAFVPTAKCKHTTVSQQSYSVVGTQRNLFHCCISRQRNLFEVWVPRRAVCPTTGSPPSELSPSIAPAHPKIPERVEQCCVSRILSPTCPCFGKLDLSAGGRVRGVVEGECVRGGVGGCSGWGAVGGGVVHDEWYLSWCSQLC